jgi:hypothetical protein
VVIVEQSHSCVQQIKFWQYFICKICTLFGGNNRRIPKRLTTGKITADHIVTVRQILEKLWEQNVYVRILFIDFQAAYDTEWRKEM